MADLATLYQGALLGPAFSTKLGTTAATGEDISQEIRGNLLATAVATGKINPKTLSPADTSSMAGFIGKPPPLQQTGGGGGILGDITGALGTVGNVIGSNVTDFAKGIEGVVTEGLPTLAEDLYRSLNPAGNAIDSALGLPTYKTPPGPGIGDFVTSLAKGVENDFTNFSIYRADRPLLDIAGLASGGAGATARVGAGLARVGEEGGAVARAGEALTKAAAGGARTMPLVGPSTAEDYARAGVQAPSIPVSGGYYATAPFRRMFIQKPFDALMSTPAMSNISLPRQLPGVAEGSTINDLRAAYNIRRAHNVVRGRMGSFSMSELVNATQGFNKAMDDLLKESGRNPLVASDKFNALTLSKMLAADNLTPAERLDRLDQYRERVLMTPITPDTSALGPLSNTDEVKQIRDFNKRLVASPDYRKYFSEPTEAMTRVSQEMTNSAIEGLKKLNFDPNEVLNRSLGPAAHIYGKTPEEVLREQPAIVQAQMNFARDAYEVEQALKESGGGDVEAEALSKRMAQQLPGTASTEAKLKLVTDAIESFKADMSGDYSRRALNNNAGATGYLQGNTLAQKVAIGLRDRLGVDPEMAEPFSYGGLTNYFPSTSALNMKVRPAVGRIGRAMAKLPGLGRDIAGRDVLTEYKHGNPIRLLKAQELGVAPYSDFLHQTELELFKAGVDRRDPQTFIRHVRQRERLISHRLLSEPFTEKMALKARDGTIKNYGSRMELQGDVGIHQAANYTLFPAKAIRVLEESENAAGKEVADLLTGSGGVVTKDMDDRINEIIDESAMEFSRQVSDTAIADNGKMIAVPNAYANNLIRHARILDDARRSGGLYMAFIKRWRTAVLALMPAWVLRTTIGHGLVAYLAGAWDPTHYRQAMTDFREGFKVPSTKFGADALNREAAPGLAQGSPFKEYGGHQDVLGLNRFPRVTTGAVHRVNNFQRRALFISSLNRVARLRFQELSDSMKIPRVLTNHDIRYLLENHPDMVQHAMNEVDRASYSFGQMSPWERRLAKYVMPFYGWKKFITKFVWSLPATYPGRAMVLSHLGQMGLSGQANLGPIPDWLNSALMFDTHNLQQIHYLSTLGLNPLGDIVNPAGGFQGLVNLGQMSPVIQAVIEGLGYDPLTGGTESIDPTSGVIQVNGQFINLKTGKAYENIDQASPGTSFLRAIGGLARSFPELRIAEQLLTSGHAVYPESIPFVRERPIPLAVGSKAKNVSPTGIALQLLGVAPRTYNLQGYQQRLLTNVERARSTYLNDVAKQRAQGILPKVK